MGTEVGSKVVLAEISDHDNNSHNEINYPDAKDHSP